MAARNVTRAVVSLVALALVTAQSPMAWAGDTSVAEQLFSEGLKAMERGDFKTACESFQGSQEADPSPGTLINLALCHEKQGKTASAWGEYRTAAGMAEQRGQSERVELARKAAAKLEPQLHKVVIGVQSSPEGLVVRRDGQAIPSATFNREIPVDPGEHLFEATAKAKKPWQKKVTFAANNAVDRIDIVLEDAPADAPPPGSSAVPGTIEPPRDAGGGSDGNTQRNIGYLVGVGGIIALGVAGGLQLLALSVDSDRKDLEGQLNRVDCDKNGLPTCKDLSESVESKKSAANNNQLGAIVTGAAGVLMIGGAVVLVLTAPSRRSGKPLFVPVVQPGYAGVASAFTF